MNEKHIAGHGRQCRQDHDPCPNSEHISSRPSRVLHPGRARQPLGNVFAYLPLRAFGELHEGRECAVCLLSQDMEAPERQRPVVRPLMSETRRVPGPREERWDGVASSLSYSLPALDDVWML